MIITWEVIPDNLGGCLWRACCGRACAAARSREDTEALLQAQLNAMNQPDPGPSTIQRGNQPAQE